MRSGRVNSRADRRCLGCVGKVHHEEDGRFSYGGRSAECLRSGSAGVSSCEFDASEPVAKTAVRKCSR